VRWLVGGLLAGCFAPEFPVGLPCSPTDTCPTGQTCRDGRCELAGMPEIDADPNAPDAPPGGVDGAPDAPPTTGCWAAWHAGPTFGTPRELIELSTGGFDGDPFLAADDLTLYFSRGPPQDVVVAVRPDRTSAFGPAAADFALNSLADEARVSLTADGLVAALASNRSGISFDLHEATRSSTSMPFGTPSTVPFAMVNNDMTQHDPDISDDGLRIYFAPNLGGGQRVALASRPARGAAFGPPTALAGLTAGTTSDPTLSPDELVIVYAVSMSPTPADLYVATRSSTTVEFSAGTPLSALNTTSSDGDPSLSSDGCELFFSSSRGPGGDRDLWIVDVL
jgi:Tol biopolymer transport system component